ncbi:break repair meiotic recombinase recruitment factor 1 [Xenopus laevis]|nr:break repair meiotic recombinase recruitment factor 1 [Xenopus laevis]
MKSTNLKAISSDSELKSDQLELEGSNLRCISSREHELADSQLLIALDESLHEPDQNIKKKLNSLPSTHCSQGKHVTGSPPIVCAVLPGSDTGGEEDREEDASPVVHGLILELSNLNRLIMTTHRDLRQRKGKLTFGKATVSGGKRRREM